ncbi:relaxase/mobilization nuclease domain-containing protein [Thioclava atlantica]|uniref:relaxase/mobilization nuclease domain-containing protein n=1 Tax=Thioclava atlantica TaxID=1317124 RepID=UPI000A56F2D4|nr:hypothetical protein [Thioclava atlantica]
MRAHTKRHRDAKFIEDYIFRDGADPIGGTLILENRHALRKQFERFGDGGEFLHITLSLPKGLLADRELWVQIILTQLELMQLPPHQIPWVAARHIDAECDHVHVAVILQTFLGDRVKATLSRRKTDRNHQEMAKMLGLPVPEYFDPSFPTFSPPTPERNLTNAKAKSLHGAFTAIFALDPPTSIEELAALLEAMPEPIILTTDVNIYGKQSHLFETPYGFLRGSELGTAWEPRHLKARLLLAKALPVARLICELPPIQTKLENITRAARTEIDATCLLLGGGDQSPGSARQENRHTSSAQGTPQASGTLQLGFGGAVPRSAFHIEHGTAVEPGTPAPTRRSAQSKRGAAAGPGGKAGRTRSKAPEDRDHFTAVDADHGNPDEMTFGAWLAQALYLLRKGFRGWSWRRIPDRHAIKVVFGAGDEVVISAEAMEICRDGQNAAELANVFEPFQSANEPKPSAKSAPLPSPSDEGPEF